MQAGIPELSVANLLPGRGSDLAKGTRGCLRLAIISTCIFAGRDGYAK
jgi:hypothetical protein